MAKTASDTKKKPEKKAENKAEKKAEDKAEDKAGETAYRVLARKYRPSTFEELLGQDAMVQTLTNAFAANRIAQAYMLTGVRGVGKTTTARLIARALNYVEPGKESQPTTSFTQLGVHCQAIMESRHVDVIEMDAASRTGIDDVREIIESVRYKPLNAPYKVYIIDEVHMLSKQAFNALLKTLEEPPEHVKFIFATTEIRKVPITVLSRCQRFDLRRFDTSLLVEHFGNIAAKEKVTIEPEALLAIARAAEGSARDGLSLLDQAIAYGGDEIKTADVHNMLGLVDRGRVIDLFESLMKGDIAAALSEVREQYNYGADPQAILNDFAGFVHWVTRLKIMPESADDTAFSEMERTRGKVFAEKLAMPVLTRAWQMALKGLGEVGTSPDAIMATEMVFIRIAYAADLPDPGELVKSLKSHSSKEKVDSANSEAASARPSASPPTVTTNQNQLAPVEMRQNQQLAVKAQDNEVQDNEVQAPQATGSPDPAFSSFGDIVALVGKMRDIKLKTALEKSVRPIRVSQGKIEIALEPGASHGLAGELSRKMEAWTGARWLVLIAGEGGDEPLQKQQAEAKQTLYKQAREHSLVQKVFERFPGAEIVDVKDMTPDMPDVSDDQSEE